MAKTTNQGSVDTGTPDPTSNTKKTTVADDFREAIAPIYSVMALLQGAQSLICNHPAPDRDGELWAANEILTVALTRAEEIMRKTDDLNLYERINGMEGGAA